MRSKQATRIPCRYDREPQLCHSDKHEPKARCWACLQVNEWAIGGRQTQLLARIALRWQDAQRSLGLVLSEYNMGETKAKKLHEPKERWHRKETAGNLLELHSKKNTLEVRTF